MALSGLPKLIEFLLNEGYEYRQDDDTASAVIRHVNDLKRRISELESRPTLDEDETTG